MVRAAVSTDCCVQQTDVQKTRYWLGIVGSHVLQNFALRITLAVNRDTEVREFFRLGTAVGENREVVCPLYLELIFSVMIALDHHDTDAGAL